MEGTLYTETGPSGEGPTTTIWLPPQITPFTQPSHCKSLVYGDSATICQPVYVLSYVVTENSTDTSVTLAASDCFPPGFYEINISGLGMMGMGTVMTTLAMGVRSTVPPNQALSYLVKAFPLQNAAAVTSSMSANPSSSGTPTNSALSKGQIAGIATGTAGLVAIAAVMVLIQIRRRRRHVLNAATNHGIDSYQGKPELPNESTPRAQLERTTSVAFVSEMEGDGMHPEMDGRSKPGEAPIPEALGEGTQGQMSSTAGNRE
ncbi:hypothetical protein PG984_011585 [Apiospora sp. TS-2023a]